MTARVRRGARRGESNRISHRVAALWGNRSAHLGSIATHLLGKGRIRKMVALALFLAIEL